MWPAQRPMAKRPVGAGVAVAVAADDGATPMLIVIVAIDVLTLHPCCCVYLTLTPIHRPLDQCSNYHFLRPCCFP